MTLRRLVPAAVLAAAAIPASSASAAVVQGTVVHHSKKSHSFVVAGSSGRLYAVHAASSPSLRRSVRVRAAKLNNGTYRATAVRATGARKVARLAGVVSYRSGKTFTVSAHGTSLLVHGKGAKVGRKVLVKARISADGTLTSTSTTTTGTASSMDVEGTITAIDTDARTLTITAADDATKTITIKVPDSFDITAYSVGETVTVHIRVPHLDVTANGDGTYTLAGSSADGTSGAADDPGQCQGHGAGEPGDDAGAGHHGAGDDPGDDAGDNPGDDSGGDTTGDDSGDGSGSGSSSS